MLLRNIVTGQKKWYDSCYINAPIKRNEIVFWKSPDDKETTKYKILAWKWQGYDKKISKKEKEIEDFATEALLNLDIPQAWRQELLDWKLSKR